MPATPDVVITREPDGNVIAEGGDALATALLKRAGFVIETTPRSFWYRLPWDMGEARENQMASHAARMLTAVGYQVDLDPGLDVTRVTTPTDPAGIRVVGHSVLTLVDQLNGATTYGTAAEIVDEVLDPDDGVLVRLGDFFEAAAVQANAADTDDGWELAHYFEDAAATVRDLGTDLHGADDRMRGLGPPSKSRTAGTHPPRPALPGRLATQGEATLRCAFTGLPSFVRFSLIAATDVEAAALATRLGDEAHDPRSLAELGVRIEEIGFGDPADIELAETERLIASAVEAQTTRLVDAPTWQEGVARYYATAPDRPATPAAGATDHPASAPPSPSASPTHRRSR